MPQKKEDDKKTTYGTAYTSPDGVLPQSTIPVHVPLGSYPRAREPPHKLVGVEAALHAAENPDFEVEAEFGKELNLDGRVAIVTGANGGIGLEYITLLAEMGCMVHCLDLSAEPSTEFGKCQDYIGRMHKKSGGVVFEYHKMDVTNPGEVREKISSIAERHGRLDVCIANAGILGPILDCHQYDVDWFRKVMEVNVTGTFLTIQSATAEMLSRKTGGSVVATASMSGTIINKDMHWVPYTTSKAAVIQMVKAFACELGQFDIRVNSISPGHIKTQMTSAFLGMDPTFENFWASQNPMARLGSVHELRGAVAYLASDLSSYTTGSDLQVCGGHTSW
jgi:NAD(P)-dependent dehydrogenase (short-subunit alcohol dehydrogenase family)